MPAELDNTPRLGVGHGGLICYVINSPSRRNFGGAVGASEADVEIALETGQQSASQTHTRMQGGLLLRLYLSSAGHHRPFLSGHGLAQQGNSWHGASKIPARSKAPTRILHQMLTKRHAAKSYPEVSFDTTLLPTDEDKITFAEASTSSQICPAKLEPLRKATVKGCGATTSNSINKASTALHDQLPVAFPTETVYGLSANALSQPACRAIFHAKGRPQDNPLIVHVCDLEMAEAIVKRDWTPSKAYELLIKAFWPGGITFLMPAARASSSHPPSPQTAPGFFRGNAISPLPLIVTAGHPLVGVRMPSHPLARALICRSRLPLAAPSANASGRPSPTSAEHVMFDLGGSLDDLQHSDTAPHRGRIPFILDGGPSRQGVESTVVDGVTNPNEIRILRPGAVTPEEIERCLRDGGLSDQEARLRVYGKDMVRQEAMETNPTTPGMKYRHYSPTAPVVLFETSASDSGAPSHSSWEIALRKEIQDWSVATKGQSPTHAQQIVTVGFMVLADSPLCDAIVSRSHAAVGQALYQWASQQRRRKARTSAEGSAAIARASEDSELRSCLGPAFELQLSQGITSPCNGDAAEEAVVRIVPFSLGTLDEPELAARRLFFGLRTLDHESLAAKGTSSSPSIGAGAVDLIVVESLADSGIGLAVMNRIGKAAGGKVKVSL